MKKTYQCKKCGNVYSSDLGVCPQCFTPSKKGNGKTVVKRIILSFIIFVATVSIGGIILGVVSGDLFNTTKVLTDQATSNNEGADSENLKVGSTLSANGLNITLKKVEDWNSDNMFTQPKDGYKFIRAYFVLENTNSTSRYLGSYDFTCYADNAKADMEILVKDALELGTEVSKGRILQGYIYYEVPVNAKSIEIEYDSDWWGSEAIFIVK